MDNSLNLKIPQEIIICSPNRLLDKGFLETLKQRALDPIYFSEPGSAEEFLGLLEGKLAEVPRDQVVGDSAERIREISVILKSWTLSLFSLEEVRAFFKENSKVFLQNETLSSDNLLSRVALAHIGMPDLFLRWADAVVDGFRLCQEMIGVHQITIYSGATVTPTIEHWISDFERYAVNHGTGSSIIIAEYLIKSPNVRTLNDNDKELVKRLFQWFSIFRFRETPYGSPASSEPEQFIKAQSNRETIRPEAVIPVLGQKSNPVTVPPKPPVLQPIRQPIRPKPLNKAPLTGSAPQAQVKAGLGPSLEAKVRQSLSQGRALIDHYEKAEKVLPPIDRASIGQLAILADGSIKGGDSTRAVAGLFQIARKNGLVALAEDSSFMQVVRQTVGPYLQTIRHISPDLALRAVDLSPNRMLIVKGFIRILLTRATGNEANAARVMVHIAGLVPPRLAGSEATFAYFDLPSGQYRWADTAVESDGILRNEIN